jgi:hypothetical protein
MTKSEYQNRQGAKVAKKKYQEILALLAPWRLIFFVGLGFDRCT